MTSRFRKICSTVTIRSCAFISMPFLVENMFSFQYISICACKYDKQTIYQPPGRLSHSHGVSSLIVTAQIPKYLNASAWCFWTLLRGDTTIVTFFSRVVEQGADSNWKSFTTASSSWNQVLSCDATWKMIDRVYPELKSEQDEYCKGNWELNIVKTSRRS